MLVWNFPAIFPWNHLILCHSNVQLMQCISDVRRFNCSIHLFSTKEKTTDENKQKLLFVHCIKRRNNSLRFQPRRVHSHAFYNVYGVCLREVKNGRDIERRRIQWKWLSISRKSIWNVISFSLHGIDSKWKICFYFCEQSSFVEYIWHISSVESLKKFTLIKITRHLSGSNWVELYK